MTSGEPALAHAFAQSGLIGFFRFLVNVQAESITYPLTVVTVAVLASGAAISTTALASAHTPATIRIDPPKKECVPNSLHASPPNSIVSFC
jgi:hypothetical protein